jgi:hypothetical protein
VKWESEYEESESVSFDQIWGGLVDEGFGHLDVSCNSSWLDAYYEPSEKKNDK